MDSGSGGIRGHVARCVDNGGRRRLGGRVGAFPVVGLSGVDISLQCLLLVLLLLLALVLGLGRVLLFLCFRSFGLLLRQDLVDIVKPRIAVRVVARRRLHTHQVLAELAVVEAEDGLEIQRARLGEGNRGLAIERDLLVPVSAIDLVVRHGFPVDLGKLLEPACDGI